MNKKRISGLSERVLYVNLTLMRKRYVSKFFSVLVLVGGLVVGVSLVKEQADFFTKAKGEPANLLIDAGSSFGDSKDSWMNIAQGGEERGRPLEAVIPDVRNLGFQYIRIDHMYDFYNVVQRTPDGKLSYDWTGLDQYVRDILATGAKPFFALSYMPSAISSGNEIAMPKLMSEWTEVVRATIEHYSGRRGLAIENVYYEVWNEPDLFGGFKVYGEKNYLDLYRASAKGAASAQNTLPFKFGGPATTGLYKNWLIALLDASKNESLRMDFFSWHKYGSDIEKYEDDIRNLRIWLNEKGNPNVELILTETGIDSANNPAYDGKTSAIHTIVTSVVLADEIDRVFHFEVKDGPGISKNWGRWGILTHEKWGKPERKVRYEALEFLNRMKGGRRINIAGEGSWVKSFGREMGNGIQILVVNYDESGKHVEAVPLKFTNLTSGRFIFRRRDFLGKTTQVPVNIDGREWSTVQYFPVNSAAIFEILYLP